MSQSIPPTAITHRHHLQTLTSSIRCLHQVVQVNPRQRKRTTYGTLSLVRKGNDSHRILFYRAESGREPVREWLKQLDALDRKRIGEDLYTLQLGWPTGMPLARKLAPELWEFRCFVGDGVARIIFTAIDKNLVLINGFIKKSKKLPLKELALAKRRLSIIKNEMNR